MQKKDDQGNKYDIITIRKTAVLFVVLSFIDAAFIPVVATQPMEKNYARLTIPDTNIKLFSEDGRNPAAGEKHDINDRDCSSRRVS